MRYNNVPTVSFTTINKQSFPVKDMREIPAYVTAFSLKLQIGDFIDEIASREEIYGEDAEGDSYKIVEANYSLLADYNFDVSKIRELMIPV
jgi:hypothetical protein